MPARLELVPSQAQAQQGLVLQLPELVQAQEPPELA